MKQQIGVRVDSKLWSQFKQLCSQAHLRPNEPLESFLKACLSQQSVTTVLNKLESLNKGEKTAYKIKLEKLLTDLKGYFQYDVKHGIAENYIYVKDLIKDVTSLLLKTDDESLIQKAEKQIDEVLSYYSKFFEKAETPPDEII